MRQDFSRFVSELCALAEAGLVGDDDALERHTTSVMDVYDESYWAGVREGQRVLAERLVDILNCHRDLF